MEHGGLLVVISKSFSGSGSLTAIGSAGGPASAGNLRGIGRAVALEEGVLIYFGLQDISGASNFNYIVSGGTSGAGKGSRESLNGGAGGSGTVSIGRIFEGVYFKH